MNITGKHLATLDSVATHIFVDGGRILFSAQFDGTFEKVVKQKKVKKVKK